MLHLIGLATGFLMVELPPDSAGVCGPARYLSAGYECTSSALNAKSCVNDLCEGAGKGILQPGAPGNSDGGGNGENGGAGNNGAGVPGGPSLGNTVPGGGTSDGVGFSVTPGVFSPGPAAGGQGNTQPGPGIPGFKIQPLMYDSQTSRPIAPPVPLVPVRPALGTKVVRVPPPAVFTKTLLVQSVVTAHIPQFTTLFVNRPPVTIKEPPVTTTYTMPAEVVVETQPPVVVALPPSTVVSTLPPKTIVETLPPETVTEPAVTITMTERYTMPPVTSIHTQVYPPVTFTKVYPPVTFTKTYPPVTIASPPSTLFVVSTSVPPPRVFTRHTTIYITSTVRNRPFTVTYFVERPSARFSTVYRSRPINVRVPVRPSNILFNRSGGGRGPGKSMPGVPGGRMPGPPGGSMSGLPGGGIPSSGVPGSGVPGSGVPGSGVPGSGNTPGSGNAQGSSSTPDFAFSNIISGGGSRPNVITIPSEVNTGVGTSCDPAVSPCVESLMTGTYTPPPSDDVCSDTNFSACTSLQPEAAASPSKKRKKKRSKDSSEGGNTKKNSAESEQESESSQQDSQKKRKSKRNKKNSKDNADVKNDTKNASDKSRASSLKSELNSSADNPSQNGNPNWLINKIASLVSSTPKKSNLVPEEGTANNNDKTEVLYLSDLLGNQK